MVPSCARDVILASRIEMLGREGRRPIAVVLVLGVAPELLVIIRIVRIAAVEKGNGNYWDVAELLEDFYFADCCYWDSLAGVVDHDLFQGDLGAFAGVGVVGDANGEAFAFAFVEGVAENFSAAVF